MRILLALDGSRSANMARDLVAAMPWPGASAIRIVSVVPRHASLGIDLSPEAANRRRSIGTGTPACVPMPSPSPTPSASSQPAHPDIRIERFLLRGRAASLILQEARDFAADLIVVGHRGHGTIETMLLGSVSAEVVDHAPCAVLVARSAERGRIVFADDGSPSARVAASVLESLPLPPTTPISVVTVSDEAFPYETAISPALYNEAMALRPRRARTKLTRRRSQSRPPPQPGSSSSATAPHPRCAPAILRTKSWSTRGSSGRACSCSAHGGTPASDASFSEAWPAMC